MSPTGNGLRTDPPQLANPDKAIGAIEQSIQAAVADAGVDRVVVNVSGGIDSAVTATLAVQALGSDRVTGLILPAETNSEANIDDARHVVEELVIDSQVIDIQPLLDTFLRTVTSHSQESRSDPLGTRQSVMTIPTKHRNNVPLAMGNAAARLRMMIAYFEANTTNALVAGTGNLTELQLGYFTKFGDGACDFLPIGDLYKSEIRQLARALDIRELIIEKKPTAGLWPGQEDEEELGASYEHIDTVLWNLLETKLPPAFIAEATETDIDLVEAFHTMVDDAAHKRRTPPTATELSSTVIEHT